MIYTCCYSDLNDNTPDIIKERLIPFHYPKHKHSFIREMRIEGPPRTVAVLSRDWDTQWNEWG